MKIIEPYYQILPDISEGGIKELQFIEKAARTCYKSEDKITQDGESAKRLVKQLIQSGHEAMLEHSSLSVKFVVDRGVSHEIVRHRLFSFAQESTRYCNYSKGKFGSELTFIEPCFWDEDSNFYLMWKLCCMEAEKDYIRFIEDGATPQEARTVLPNSVKTELIVTGNYREWRHFLKLRTDKAAHPQMREVAIPLLKELQRRIPIVFDDIRVDAEQMVHNKEGRPLAYWYAPASYKSEEYCSNCHERTRSEGDDGEKYCINCGAEMIDEQSYRRMHDRGLC
jgi:thymidylate synthase (FAD)